VNVLVLGVRLEVLSDELLKGLASTQSERFQSSLLVLLAIDDGFSAWSSTPLGR
jgi:hypothetical protein